MEIEGHPTQDLIDELVRRGASTMPGNPDGPDPGALIEAGLGSRRGYWMYVTDETYQTEIDEGPPVMI